MEELIKNLYLIRDFILKRDGCERMIYTLKEELKPKRPLIQEKNEKVRANLGFSVYALIFWILTMIFGKPVDSMVYYQWLIRVEPELPQEIFESVINTHEVKLGVAMLFGIPVGLAITLLIYLIVRLIDVIRSKVNARKNIRIRMENKQIEQINQEIETKNQQIQRTIMLNEDVKRQALEDFHREAGWFPDAYFDREIVEYIIKRLESRTVESISQAIVYYEAGDRL